MKPWSVIRMPQGDQLHDLIPGRGDMHFIVWGSVEQLSTQQPQVFDGNHPVYFLDSEGEANMLASFLAAKRPGIMFLVAKSTSSFRCAAAPVAKAMFTEHGMLPAV